MSVQGLYIAGRFPSIIMECKCFKAQGENLDGSSSSIVFYSARGIERLKDLTGRGADHSCGTHKPEDQ